MFTIYLPRVLDAGSVEPSSEPATTNPLNAPPKSILVVEDESTVRELIVRVLSSAGYRVISADSGADAIERAERHQGTIDLMLSDVVMPGVPVAQLIHVLRERRPAIGVLLMSGYPDGEIARRGLPIDQFPLLDKPIVVDTLLEIVARQLAARLPNDARVLEGMRVA